MREIVKKVIDWGKDKGILPDAAPEKQFEKTIEEVLELHRAIVTNDSLELIDAIGDIQVTLILQCELQGLDFDECLESAYDVIKHRSGKMVDGKFVKDDKES